MKTKKTTLFSVLAFALLMSMGTTLHAGFNCPIDDPIVDPDLLDRPRVSVEATGSGQSGAVEATVLQQGDQLTVVFEQPAGEVAVVIQTSDGEILYAGTVNTNAVPALSILLEEEDTIIPNYNKQIGL